MCWKYLLLSALLSVSLSAGTQFGGSSTAAADDDDFLDCCDAVISDAICYNVCIEALTLGSGDVTLTSADILVMSSACSPVYTAFWTCFNQSRIFTENLFTETPTPDFPITPSYYYCCDETADVGCATACKDILLSGFQDNVGALINACGPPPQDPVWGCLLSHPDTSAPPPSTELLPQPPGVDWARLQCCYQARAYECRQSCVELYTGQVSTASWQRFQLDCIHRPSENVLSTCLADVSEPCKLGCSRLQFCSNFNNRPLELFRDCTTSADRMARDSYAGWLASGVVHHPLITIYVGDIAICLSEMWKAVACITHVQPCHPQTHSRQICRADCLKLLTGCSNETSSTHTVCNIIAPSDANCISITEYLTPGLQRSSALLLNPCDPNPCTDGFYCSINHMCRSGDFTCSAYSCRPGCMLGERPSFVVPSKSAVRVTLVSDTGSCFGYFNCTSEVAGSLPPALALDSGDSGYGDVVARNVPVLKYCEEEELDCYDDGIIILHHTTFWKECNFCACSYGRVSCTNHSCGQHTNYLPCDCPAVYQPVCTTTDGHTIPNSCYAHCLGYGSHELRAGDCWAASSCASDTMCSDVTGSRCVPNRQTCVSADRHAAECKQYTCELTSLDCATGAVPVCDFSHHQHPTLCALLRTHAHFNYFGYCTMDCSSSMSQWVCGVNGESFVSRCHADNVRIAVDYTGSCSAVPTSGVHRGARCAGVECPVLQDCTGVTPQGACCPQCGGHLTIVMDKDILWRNVQALGLSSLSSPDIVERLRYHISALQCDLYGHFSLDGSLSVLVLPTRNSSVPLVIESCNREAIKLATFINNRSPVVASDPLLSHLTAAHVQTSSNKASVGTQAPSIRFTVSPTSALPNAISSTNGVHTLNWCFCFIMHVFSLWVALGNVVR